MPVIGDQFFGVEAEAILGGEMADPVFHAGPDFLFAKAAADEVTDAHAVNVDGHRDFIEA